MTTFRVDRESMCASNERARGPASTVVAELGHDLVAEVDVADGVVITVRDVSFLPPVSRAELLDLIVQSDDALDAVRRIVLATAYGAEEPHEDSRWFLLDRTSGRLDLETAVPALRVDPNDQELSDALEFLTDSRLQVPSGKLLPAQAVIDVIRRKLPEFVELPTTGEIVEASISELVTLGTRSGDANPVHLGIDPPHVVVLSAGPDLASAMARRDPYLEAHGELEVVLNIPVIASMQYREQLACYLVEPEDTHPIAQVSMLAFVVESERTMLSARFRVLPNADLTRCEFVVLPVWQSPAGIIGASTARSLLEAEIRLRTAIRLAQKSMHQEALARLADSEQAYRAARPAVPPYFKDRLARIRRLIEDQEYPFDLLGDM